VTLRIYSSKHDCYKNCVPDVNRESCENTPKKPQRPAVKAREAGPIKQAAPGWPDAVPGRYAQSQDGFERPNS